MLSGGLSSSPYIQGRIKARYETGIAALGPSVDSPKVLIAGEPYEACSLSGSDCTDNYQAACSNSWSCDGASSSEPGWTGYVLAAMQPRELWHHVS